MEKELITIIIPVYNVEKYLNKCIESVINQTYKKIEIILVDDGSLDKSGQICDEYAKRDMRIKVIHKENGGLSDARNKGLDITTGNYVYLLDSDDFIEKDTIEYLYNLAKQHDAQIVIGREKLVYENLETQSENIFDIKKEKIEVFNSKQALEVMLYNYKFSNMGCNKLYKTSIFEKIRYPFGKLYEDLGTTYKLIVNSNIIVLSNKYTYNYLVNRTDSIMNKNFNEKRMDGLEFAEEILKFVNTKYPDLTEAAIFRLYIECIFILLKLPKGKQYKEYNTKILGYLKKYRVNILRNKRISNKQKLLCITSIFGRYILRVVWNIKENIKKMKKGENK